jgi:16S rRNA (cytosine967-C5)-methyltransferase
MNNDARFLAITILCRWCDSGKPVDLVADEILAKIKLDDQRDRPLIMAIIYGTIRWQGYLDWVLSGFSKHDISAMKTLTLQALRVGLYQLLFMDRIPVSAAVNQTVSALKASRQPKWLIGFANGLLRNIARNIETIAKPDDIAALPDTARLSHPAWLIKRWQQRYGGNQTDEICSINNSPPPLVLRTNTRKISRAKLLSLLIAEKITANPGTFATDAIQIKEYRGAINALPGYGEGLFQVQDESAQLITFLLGSITPDNFYLDACAGLGGKTSHLAQVMPKKEGQKSPPIHAVEPDRKRLALLKDNLLRLGLRSLVHLVPHQLQEVRFDRGYAGILLDAPCSGLGVIRRNPDIRWNRKPDQLKAYQEKQLQLLEASAALLQPEGVLVYATCSMEPEENDDVITKFLADHTEFSLNDCRFLLPKTAHPLVDADGFFRTLPDLNGLGGFFAARMQKIKI